MPSCFEEARSAASSMASCTEFGPAYEVVDLSGPGIVVLVVGLAKFVVDPVNGGHRAGSAIGGFTNGAGRQCWGER